MDVPIKATANSLPIISGLILHLSGKIQGAVKPQRSSFNVGDLEIGRQTVLDVGLNANGVPLKVLSVQNGLGKWARVEIAAGDTNTANLRITMDPPLEMAGKPLSGIFEVRVATNYEENLKILVFGRVR